MDKKQTRPISPHLQVYKWGPHMAISIFHRMTGNILAVAGGILLLWWLYALANGPESFQSFKDCLAWYNIGYVILIGLSWTFFQHLFSGIRHFVLDIGAGYELTSNKSWSIIVFIAAILCTTALWAYIFYASGSVTNG
ncbi:succinate dehydrogenase, cytochrome b556 subunit [Sphingorhabdus lutea]|uniref:Succinate dehydrogenase cytochrome b556 subunit n=1 Tax=Sphingorhabdus lutea TaxID=1913578 RepID=A0A1L3JDA2_9SPHN|nr:succinate dehydrogenase, cytochrome b556 subunit [Sphingorhabdus lutea]APG63069.1 succinate dehydrogenase, cytochrome b556 subunit [Sphingorhabdus lutea]